MSGGGGLVHEDGIEPASWTGRPVCEGFLHAGLGGGRRESLV